MDSYIALAQLADRSRHGIAFSALPDAPVLPVRPPRRLTLAWRAGVRTLLRPWNVALPHRSRPQCAGTA